MQDINSTVILASVSAPILAVTTNMNVNVNVPPTLTLGKLVSNYTFMHSALRGSAPIPVDTQPVYVIPVGAPDFNTYPVVRQSGC
jgi:hypothetical protein